MDPHIKFVLVINRFIENKKLVFYFLNFSKKTSFFVDKKESGGESGIRTHDRVNPIHTFQACALNHSAISPNY